MTGLISHQSTTVGNLFLISGPWNEPEGISALAHPVDEKGSLASFRDNNSLIDPSPTKSLESTKAHLSRKQAMAL